MLDLRMPETDGRRVPTDVKKDPTLVPECAEAVKPGVILPLLRPTGRFTLRRHDACQPGVSESVHAAMRHVPVTMVPTSESQTDMWTSYEVQEDFSFPSRLIRCNLPRSWNPSESSDFTPMKLPRK